MQQLADGILLYHGGYTEITKIDLSMCKGGLDFGKGFYLTSSYQQARNYIPSSIKKTSGVANCQQISVSMTGASQFFDFTQILNF